MNFHIIRTASWVLVLLLFSALIQVAEGAGSKAETSDETIVVGYIPIVDCLQLYVAEGMGFFDAEGLKINKIAMKGGAAIAPALESGVVAIGWSNSVSIIIAHTKGFDFSFLTPGAVEMEVGHRTHSLLVPSNSSIRQIAGLNGKKVAINTLGNVNELSILALAEMNGLDGKRISLVEVPFPNMEAALANNSVDAALVAEPFVTITLSHGSARCLEPSAHKALGDKFMVASWFAKQSWIEKNPSKALRFAKAVRKASEYISKYPEDVSRFLVESTRLSPDLAEKISLPAFPPSFEVKDLQKLIDLAAKYKFIVAPFDAKEIISPYAQQ